MVVPKDHERTADIGGDNEDVVPSEEHAYQERQPLAQADSVATNDSSTVGYHQEERGYTQISTRGDDDPEEPEDLRDPTEYDPLNYPPAPPGYYRRDRPTKITHCGKLICVLLAVGTACLAIAAVIDVSSPSTRFEPGRDKQSVADGVLAGLDRSADPCENFYEYACGSWLRTAKIPLDRSRYSRSFSVVFDRIQLMAKEILEVDLQKAGGSEPSKAGVFYASCIDQMGIGGLNTLYLSPFRDEFNALSDASSFQKLIAKIHKRASTAFFDMDVSIDAKFPTKYAVYLGQGGLGLPHRDDYFSMKDFDVELRRRYVSLMVTMLNTAGKARLIPRQGNDVLARDILDLEKELANSSLPPEELRDPEKTYNKVIIDKLPADFHVQDYLSAMGVDASLINGSIVIDNVIFFDKVAMIMAKLASSVDIRRVVRGYMAFHMVRNAASQGLLGESMYHENFKFAQYVYGLKQLPEQWKSCQALTNKYLGEEVGGVFVKKHFPEKLKSVARNLATKISRSFADALKTEDWMDEETRKAASEKQSKIDWKVGYSEKLDTYEDVHVSRASLKDNVVSALTHRWRKMINKLGKPIDHTEWFMRPHEVNAYYSSTRNEMVFPAGILQPPFFSDAYPDAMNYGSIGAVIGHEMSHGFDDQGRKYDKDGRLTPWWTAASGTRYDKRANCFVDLYDTYKPRDVDIHVRGKLTLGENLADTNGVNVAYRAFKSYGNNTRDGIPPPNKLLARELTNDQLFFVSYAQTWCTLYREKALKVQMMTDPHSPGQFRVLGPLSQSPAFAEAFKCRNGSKYNPAERCHLW